MMIPAVAQERTHLTPFFALLDLCHLNSSGQHLDFSSARWFDLEKRSCGCSKCEKMQCIQVKIPMGHLQSQLTKLSSLFFRGGLGNFQKFHEILMDFKGFGPWKTWPPLAHPKKATVNAFHSGRHTFGEPQMRNAVTVMCSGIPCGCERFKRRPWNVAIRPY